MSNAGSHRVNAGDAGYLDPAGNYVPETHFVGSGPAWLFHDGRVIRATWTKDKLTSTLSLEAKERRTIGILAAERGVQRAAAMGALALVQAKLEYALRVRPSGTNLSQFAAFDPWLRIDSTLTGRMLVDSIPVDARAHTLREAVTFTLKAASTPADEETTGQSRDAVVVRTAS